jgi:hypothetical protein
LPNCPTRLEELLERPPDRMREPLLAHARMPTGHRVQT